MYKKLSSYFSKHIIFSSSVHVLIGLGLGILITYPFIGSHPLRWGTAILVIGLLGHLYPLMVKK